MRELPFEIRSRAELIDAVSVAASVEHTVLLQYLYAAFSCRGTSDPSVPPRVQLASLNMARELYLISHEEMEHLGAVQTLLAGLGAPPVPDTWPFPVTEPLKAQLTRLDGPAIERFVRAEAPPPAERAIAPPDPIEFEFLGDLYRGIAQGIQDFGDQAFVGAAVTGNAPVILDFGRILPVRNKQEALRTLAAIVEEGEGATVTSTTGHWARFKAMRDAYAELGADADLVSWNCVPNPSVQPRQPGTTQLSHPFTVQLGDVSNRVYRALWRMLAGTYAFDWSPQDAPAIRNAREALRRRFGIAARHLMATGVRPLGELMARLPAFTADTGQTGGFPFEQYEAFRVPTQPDARLINLVDELAVIATDLKMLAEDAELPDVRVRVRLAAAADDVTAIRRRLIGDWPPPQARPRYEPPSAGGRFLSVDFEGYYQVRLATGGDPYADPRGVSGWIFALPGEPDLDRVLRLKAQGTSLRDHIDPDIEIGVAVTSATSATGPEVSLVGAAVDFLDSAVFEGHNGVLSNDGDEPIVPMRISVSGGGWRLERSAEDEYTSPFTKQTALGQVRSPDSAELRARLGVPVVTGQDMAPYIENTQARLRAARDDALTRGDQDAAAVLAFRHDQIGSPNWTFLADVGWRLELTGSDAVAEHPGALPVSTTASWWLELLSTGYDPDAQTAVLRGVLHVPLTDSQHFPAWRLRFPSQGEAVMPVDDLGLRPGR